MGVGLVLDSVGLVADLELVAVGGVGSAWAAIAELPWS